MFKTILSAFCLAAAIAAPVLADETYSIHEKQYVGHQERFALLYTYKVKSTSTTGGKSTVTDTDESESWKMTQTVLAESNGSATRLRVEFDPDSVDTTKNAGGPPTKTPCPFIGKTIVLRMHPDNSITNDFQGSASDDDLNYLNGILIPDDDFFPDKPVAAGDTWDNTAKYARHAGEGPKDKLASRCKLDWVKTIGGKQMAQISVAVAVINYEDGNVEEDNEWTSTSLVDLAAGEIVKCDCRGSSKYITPPSEATQVTGGTEFTFHAEAIPDAQPTTKP